MHEDPVPRFRANRYFNKLALFAAMVLCGFLSQALPYGSLWAFVLGAIILGILLLYAEVLKDQIIEAIKGNEPHGDLPGESAPPEAGASGDRT